MLLLMRLNVISMTLQTANGESFLVIPNLYSDCWIGSARLTTSMRRRSLIGGESPSMPSGLNMGLRPYSRRQPTLDPCSGSMSAVTFLWSVSIPIATFRPCHQVRWNQWMMLQDMRTSSLQGRCIYIDHILLI